MNPVRTSGLIFAMAAVALATVALRAEQSRHAAAALDREAEWIALRRDLWHLQIHLARLQTPTQVHERIDWFKVKLLPPHPELESWPLASPIPGGPAFLTDEFANE